jgi:hypothetical protein
LKLFRQIKPDKSTAFRLPNGLLTTVDIICEKQDITRSQLYRRSLMEYIKNQQVEVLPEPEPKPTWSEALYRRNR